MLSKFREILRFLVDSAKSRHRGIPECLYIPKDLLSYLLYNCSFQYVFIEREHFEMFLLIINILKFFYWKRWFQDNTISLNEVAVLQHIWLAKK